MSRVRAIAMILAVALLALVAVAQTAPASVPASSPASAPSTAASAATTTAPTTGPVADGSGWAVIFRSDDPIVWNAHAGDPSDEDGFAVPMDRVPEGTRYLRLTRKDTGEAVIVQIRRDQLIEGATLDGDVQWRPATPPRGKGYETSQLLGIVRRSWPAEANNEHLLVYSKNWRGYRGWGFSKVVGENMAQTYSWNGHPIARTVFEVAVKAKDLTDYERERLITDEKRVLAHHAPGQKVARAETVIRGLAVRFSETGASTGGTGELILTATPGMARDLTPVAYAITVPDAMRLPLEDAAWAVRLKYPRWEASRVQIRYEAAPLHEMSGGNPSGLGAAIGTLLRSSLEGFEIDPDFTITGDVAADGKVRPVSGTVGRIRAAVAANAQVLALPTESESRVADAVVYDGWGLLARVQVIGVATLDDAAAVARRERESSLAEAIELFEGLRATLQKSPESIRSKPVREKLARVIELEPNHYSAKFLSLVAQDKQPRRLSREASLYSLAVATHGVRAVLDEHERALDKGAITPEPVKESLKSIDRARRMADPSVLPLAEAYRAFVKALGEVQAGASIATLPPRIRAVNEAEAKAGTGRDQMGHMVRDGI